MIIGVPKEIKDHEYRVSLTPAGVQQLVSDGHKVLVQIGAGKGSSLSDDDYRRAGADMVKSTPKIYEAADLIVKVKEPQPGEYKFLREDQILFTYLHLAPEPDLTRELLKRKINAVAYETVQLDDGSLPLLTPMSEVAGRMAVHEGAKYLESARGGKGVLLSGVPGVRPGVVTILGGGTAGLNAAKTAVGLGARVNILDISLPRLRFLDDILTNVTTLIYTPLALEELLPSTDVLIGAVLLQGARAPKLITTKMLKLMERGSVIVDVCIDQGGCLETSRPTTHSDPTYIVEGVVHYCVTNMPGAVAHTSTFALTNATFPYVQKLASLGFAGAVRQDASLARGVNIRRGCLTNRAVAEALKRKYTPLADILAGE
ncbi:MAG: alanine dehydrogenase [Candidatus Omnitrophica bacterium]|nr:alanine dehydrogenase [Candidatus Omnitrophota bacterium]